MKLAIFIFDKFVALDVIGPYEVLSRIPNSEIFITALTPGLYTDGKSLSIEAKYSLKDIPNPDVLVIPGGFGIDALLNNVELIAWVQNAHKTSKWTTSVCSGALLLAAAGILKNCKATTYWNRREQLEKYGVTIIKERYVHDGKIITSAGVSAGIDMALYLASLLVNEKLAQAIQLSMEYDPKPPFDSGSPDKAPKEIMEALMKSMNNNKK